MAWSLAIWWLGESLGGIFTGAASPLSGAPGAVLLYAVVAVLAWPASPVTVSTPARQTVARWASAGHGSSG